jgi:hypothetical protein
MTVTSPARTRPPMSRGDRAAWVAAAVLVAGSAVTGAVLSARGVPVHAPAPPLFARWLPHLGPGTPVALALAVLVAARGPWWAARWPWRRLLVAGYAVALAWIGALAMVDGWRRGVTTRLTTPGEYVSDVPRAGALRTLLPRFADHIVSGGPDAWTTHVSGHPPGAFLVFLALDRVGLGGGGPAAALCVLAGASATVSVALTVRALAGEAAARRLLPFLVLFPGAVWLGVSADALFTGVAAAALAALSAGGAVRALSGGLLLGCALYLSYGLVLLAPLAGVVLLLRGSGARRAVPAAAAGVAAVVAAVSLAGFWWPTGYRLVKVRYFQGWGSQRPYAYWVVANLACLLLSAGPVVAPALRRAAASGWAAARSIVRGGLSAAGWSPLRRVAVLLPLAALTAIGAADLSGLSKAETERIWLPFAVWLLPAVLLLPPRARRAGLVAGAAVALAVNHLLLTRW